MAKTSKIVRNKQRKKLVAKFATKRAEAKETLRKPTSTDDERDAARIALQSIPRNALPVRIRNRCELTGRARAYYRKFGRSRIALRDLASLGELPGVTKASW